jgi:hypothetical protein
MKYLIPLRSGSGLGHNPVNRFLMIGACLVLQACTSVKPVVETGSVRKDDTLDLTAEVRPAVEPASLGMSDAKQGVLELFPMDIRPGAMPVGWDKWILHPLKRKTDYGWKKDRKGVYLEAKSRSAASGLIKRLNLDPTLLPVLQFSWMIDGLLEGADVGDRLFEDSPVRVVLAFDGDKASLPVKEQAFIERVKTFTGQDVPYASLMYVWDNKRALNTIVPNPHTSRVQKIVASTGIAGIRSWQPHSRNIVADYRAAYGKDPGRLIGIAIMTDTDNTKTYAQARYRGLALLQEGAVGVTATSD